MKFLQNKWMRFVKGSLMIELHGDYLERFFNMCRMHNIYLWNIKKEQADCICNLQAADFCNIKPLLRKTGTKVKVLEKYGLPFYIPVIKHRIAFGVGVIVCLMTFEISTNYVWAIEYIGNIQISDDEMNDFVREQDITYGRKKSDIDCEEIEKRLREKFESVTWTSVYFEGTKLYVEVKENEKTEPIIREVKGTDIVATDAGVITSIVTRNGVPMVKVGDKVEKGQILVSGCVPIYDEAQNIINYHVYDADADIYIRTLTEYNDTIEKSYSTVYYTGNDETVHFIDICGYHFQGVFWKEVLGNNVFSYEKVTQKKQLVLLDNIYLPVYYGEINRKEYYTQYLEYTHQALESKLNDNLQKFILCLQEKGVQIVEKNVKIKENANNMEMVGDILVVKPTGEAKNIRDMTTWEKEELLNNEEGLEE